MTSNGRLLFYSKYAFYRPLYEVFRILCAEYGVQGHVITHESPAIPRVYAPEGYLTASAAGLGALPESVETCRVPLRAGAREIRGVVRDSGEFCTLFLLDGKT